MTLRPASEESKVTDVRTKVESGQADAGIVYVTDARAAQGVDAIAIAGAERVRNVYLIGVPATAGQPALGAEFIELVGSRQRTSRPRRRRLRVGLSMIRPPLPRWLAVPAVMAAVFLAVPLLAMLVRVPWDRLPALLAAPASMDALWLSLRTCTLSALLALALGLPLALLLSRARGRWATVVRTLATMPMVLPPVVAGLALLVALGRRSPLGAWLEASGIGLAFTTAAVVVAQTFVAMPYLVVSVEGALRSARDDFEVAAATLGAGPTTNPAPGEPAAGRTGDRLGYGAGIRQGAG